ncbi:glycoside hydrolase family 27 protein [Dyella caseinilytica]|uniref:Alpha-galactosidase n=2 Tax=Dyella caseinilytica TaxID=1849581 RepID=A0ABX7GYL8_9GAMM|nr:glycoside hydrolase family 27 protein [Dyella caseinilytica]QRN55564.1 glycoside hydrolase family 27 protein [Dyella caseinilytica]
MSPWLRSALLLPILLAAATSAGAQEIALTPPMGWNSWDSYGLTIDEGDFKANAVELAKLHAYGWTYAVIDEGWYMGNPFGDTLQHRNYAMDGNGLLIPAPKRFPSSADGQGFKPIADWVHAQGLKFGIHIVRGIPKQAVEANLPIAGSNFHAQDAADKADTCSWDDGDYGIRDNAAGQAYYDAMLALYAHWGVDFLKVDCIANNPYRISEIRQIAAAIKKTGRPIVLSLSPGPTQPSHAAEIRRYGEMWRISNDIWDGWIFKHDHPSDDFPSGLRNIFDRLLPWVGQAHDGRWPDADMLPFGMLAPHPGLGGPRHTRLTLDEERTQLTLLAMARSPLILGANLTEMDDVTRALITNRGVIAVDQYSHDNHPVEHLPVGIEQVRVWVASGKAGERYLAVFNLDDKPTTWIASWEELGMTPGAHAAHELWSGDSLDASDRLTISLPPHGCFLYRVN